MICDTLSQQYSAINRVFLSVHSHVRSSHPTFSQLLVTFYFLFLILAPTSALSNEFTEGLAVSLEVQAPDSTTAGDLFGAAVTISDLDSLYATELAICYDPKVLMFNGYSRGAYWGESGGFCVSEPDDGMVQFLCGMNDSTDAGDQGGSVLVNLSFVALTPGEASLCICPSSVSVSTLGAPVPPESIAVSCDTIYVRSPRSQELKAYNWPNPAREGEQTHFTYTVNGPSSVRIRIYDRAHELVAEIEDKTTESGKTTTDFDTSLLASGTYIYLVEVWESLSGERRQTRGKLLVVR